MKKAIEKAEVKKLKERQSNASDQKPSSSSSVVDKSKGKKHAKNIANYCSDSEIR